MLLLQCVLTGKGKKAQKAYSALSIVDCGVYKSVKATVLKAYELVPEAYHQRFRSWEKSGKQTHIDFNHWCTSLDVSSFSDLCELTVLEQFKNSVPSHIVTNIDERQVKTVTEAASLADNYVLTHRGDCDYRAPVG